MKSSFFNHRSWLEEYNAMRPFDEKPPMERAIIDTMSINEENRVRAQEDFEERKARIAEKLMESQLEREKNYSKYKASKAKP